VSFVAGILVASAITGLHFLEMLRLHHEAVCDSPIDGSLHADTVTRNGSIGIPGVTKTYEGVLINFGPLPISINRCEFIDDTMSPGASVPYRIERWDSPSLKWEPLVDLGADAFCEPYPLSMIEAKWTSRWLWPGQTLSTGWEATAARTGIAAGDTAKFVLYLDRQGRGRREIETSNFLVDEEPEFETEGLKVRH